ncbi:DinB family protein [Aestuariicoccus sp. MJ-SS9]|uniref:DinB family protein n=1 Tax=Aestuariicoccus sp. MJ-SS9 TaxID=3079855 RepID=UPI00290FB708|nr:DinB family protein [Aestuariicoccus sp. MJ-SS9]MDU8913195.1 DinB family protein [Aestuariicoccus sp. MJ-SS9]
MRLDPVYCVVMARYNAWQNRQMKAAFDTLDEAALRKDRKAFFGSILKTANHLLWADMLWMERLGAGPGPEGDAGEAGTELTPNAHEWAVARFRLDARLLLWAERLKAVELTGTVKWHSGSTGQEMARPRWQCVAHMFNHQTHHRGQIHAMLSAAGADAPVSDLAFMPQEGPWL